MAISRIVRSGLMTFKSYAKIKNAAPGVSVPEAAMDKESDQLKSHTDDTTERGCRASVAIEVDQEDHHLEGQAL